MCCQGCLQTSHAHRGVCVSSVLIGAACCCGCCVPVTGGRLVGEAVRVLPGTFFGCPAHLVRPSKEGQQGPPAVLHFFRWVGRAAAHRWPGQHSASTAQVTGGGALVRVRTGCSA
jgi:hypothetical protein